MINPRQGFSGGPSQLENGQLFPWQLPPSALQGAQTVQPLAPGGTATGTPDQYGGVAPVVSVGPDDPNPRSYVGDASGWQNGVITSDPELEAHLDRTGKTAQNQAAIKIALLLGGSAAAGNALGPLDSAASAAPEAGGLGTSSIVPDVSTVGGSAAGVPTEALSAPSTGGESAGWFSKISNLIPKGGMGGGGGSSATPAYGDYSRIADQLSRAQINDQRRQVAAQAGAQGQSLQDMKRRRIAALMMAGTPQVPA